MSFDDAEILGGHTIGYDEYPGVRMDDLTDLDLLHDNRSTRYGEPRDTLWPLSNFRGGWDNEGSGPHVSYSSQIGSPLNIVQRGNGMSRGNGISTGRNIEWDRNANNSPDLPLSDILKDKKERLQKEVQNDVLGLLNLQKKIKKQQERADNPTAVTTTEPKQSFWAGQNTTTLLLILVFILLVATIAVQHLHTRRLTDILQLVLNDTKRE